jgi:hypothetical protein
MAGKKQWARCLLGVLWYLRHSPVWWLSAVRWLMMMMMMKSWRKDDRMGERLRGELLEGTPG